MDKRFEYAVVLLSLSILLLVLAFVFLIVVVRDVDSEIQAQVEALENQLSFVNSKLVMDVVIYPPETGQMISFGYGEPEHFPLGSLETDEGIAMRILDRRSILGATFYLMDKDGNILDSVDVTNHVDIGETAYAWCDTGGVGEDWWPEGLADIKHRRITWFPIGGSCMTIAYGG